MTASGRSKRTEKLQLLLNDEELTAIDDWRFDNRIPTRAATIRELLRRGLQSMETTDIPPTATTHDYSVVR
jgi:hypothetical protein